MDANRLKITRDKCYLSLVAGIQRLCDIETWPRPTAARRLRMGHDFDYNQMKDIPERDDYLSFLLSDDKIKTNYDGYRLYRIWQLLLLRLLPEVDGKTLKRSIFTKWFNLYIRELYKPYATWRTVYYVSGLKLEVKRINIDDCTVLMKLPSPRNFQNIWGNQTFVKEGYSEPIEAGGTGNINAIIVINERFAKKEYSYTDSPFQQITNSTRDEERSKSLIDSIRLNIGGAPRLYSHVIVHISKFPLNEPSGYIYPYDDYDVSRSKVSIGRGDISRIKGTWNELMGVKSFNPLVDYRKPNKLDIALRGLSRSYELKYWMDNILDITIALESLFSPDKNQELKHRISLRVAWLLSSENKTTNLSENRVYNCVRAMYDIRSTRVHGDIPKDSEVHKWVQTLSGNQYDKSDKAVERELLDQAVSNARFIVRIAILGCMELQKSPNQNGPHWPLSRDFDQNILNPRQQRIWQKAAKIKPLLD